MQNNDRNRPQLMKPLVFDMTETRDALVYAHKKLRISESKLLLQWPNGNPLAMFNGENAETGDFTVQLKKRRVDGVIENLGPSYAFTKALHETIDNDKIEIVSFSTWEDDLNLEEGECLYVYATPSDAEGNFAIFGKVFLSLDMLVVGS